MEPTPAFRVLVVEDEPLIAMVVEDSIEMLGYEVIGPVAQHDERWPSLPLVVSIVRYWTSIFAVGTAMTLRICCFLAGVRSFWRPATATGRFRAIWLGRRG